MMDEIERWTPGSGMRRRVGMVSTYPPTRCGIASFSKSLVTALTEIDPGLEVDMVRLVTDRDPRAASWPVQMEIDPNSEVSVRAAARHLSSSDVVVLQHEFGIFGSNDGMAVLDLVTAIEPPKIVVLHTVLPDPTGAQLRILHDLATSSTLVVTCDAARRLLVDRYQIATEAIEMIPHGAKWGPQPVNHQPRRQLITWGLLGPGKGLERSIAAIAELKDLDPPVHYRIVGRTHPIVAERSGFSYRHSLEKLVEDLGLTDNVEFVDRYVDDEELFEMVSRSDVVIAPYDNADQVSSGVVTEAIGLARPVVATPFPYAVEILGDGAGVVVDHDPSSMAEAIEALLEDPISYRRAYRAGSLTAEAIGWASVGRRYSGLIRAHSSDLATA